MIATRRIMKVENRSLVLDIGEDYEALMNRDVEILIFPCPYEEKDGETSERPLPWGALRGSVDNIASDFDKPEDESAF